MANKPKKLMYTLIFIGLLVGGPGCGREDSSLDGGTPSIDAGADGGIDSGSDTETGNDTDGDRDKTLRHIVSLLSDQTRWADLVGCNANQDFILALQETTQDAALVLVDKLAAQIKRLNESADSPVSACFGVTQCQKNDDAVSMLERAESALAEARRNDSGTFVAT